VIETARVLVSLEFAFAVPETVEFYHVHYGPTLRAFTGLSDPCQAALRRDLEERYTRRNKSADGATKIAAEYLEVKQYGRKSGARPALCPHFRIVRAGSCRG
jgi:hypothetical protein